MSRASTADRHLMDRGASAIELRLMDAGDGDAVRRLAALDDAEPLEGQVLVAFVDGEPVAALSLRGRRAVADPFVPTADISALLRLRADLLTTTPRERRLRRVRRILAPRAG